MMMINMMMRRSFQAALEETQLRVAIACKGALVTKSSVGFPLFVARMRRAAQPLQDLSRLSR